MAERKPLGQILKEIAGISENDVQRGLRLGEQKKIKIGQALIQLGVADEASVARALCRQFGLPFVDLGKVKLPAATVALLDADLVRQYQVIPVKKEATGLILAVDDPDRMLLLDDLRFRAGIEFRCALTTPTAFREALATYYGIDLGSEQAAAAAAADAEDAEGEDAPVIRLVNKILDEALTSRASDIHVEPMAEKLRVRYRIDGYCKEVEGPPLHLTAAVLSRIKLMARMDISEKRKPQDGRINIRLQGREIDLRVSSLPAYHGESVVMRILDRERGLISLPELGFAQEEYQRFLKIIKRPNGLFLVTGPTGSGKTTSLYAALRELNRPDVKIITAEDPVEYNLAGINQCQVRHNIGLNFARILRAMLRQAPNIILVGEIRDKETAEIAIQASLTGHLVFSTLHTNDAPSALTRLIDMGVKPFLVSTAVMAVMAQRLIRRLCRKCKEPYEPTALELRQLGLTSDDLKGRTVYKPGGCEDCGQTGYRGRVGAYELFAMDSTLREMCFRGASSVKLREQARISGGMSTLLEDGVKKFLAGETTIEEVLTVAIAGEAAAA
ncbi:MAG: Type II secretion system protein E [Planctomycetes bacterium]|nr:Type II secretion system protein E [Planctomycetota bacterium]